MLGRSSHKGARPSLISSSFLTWHTPCYITDMHTDAGQKVPIPPPSTTEPQLSPTIELTLTALRALMWEFPELSNITSLSLARGDTYAPKIAPLEFHEIVRHIDPQSSVFHVIPYPDHCEVWHAVHWQRSSSRIHAIITASDARCAKYFEQHRAAEATDTTRKLVYDELNRLMPMVGAEILWNLSNALSVGSKEFFATVSLPSIFKIVHPEPTSSTPSPNEPSLSTAVTPVLINCAGEI